MWRDMIGRCKLPAMQPLACDPARRALLRCGLASLLAPAVQANSRTLRCVSLDYPPLVHQVGGVVQGIAVDLVRAALEPAGWRVEVEVLPWKRALGLMERGERDCIFTIFRTPEREIYLDYSQRPLVLQPIAWFARRDRTWFWDGNPATLERRRVALVRGVNYGQVFERLRPLLSITETDLVEAPFRMLQRGHAELTVANAFLATHLRSQNPALWADLEPLGPSIEIVSSYIAFAKGRHSGPRAEFDARIDALRARLMPAAWRALAVPPDWQSWFAEQAAAGLKE